MELYQRFPKACTVWCCAEIFLFAGLLFGWNSLLFILKHEGFYLRECYLDEDGFTLFKPALTTEGPLLINEETLVDKDIRYQRLNNNTSRVRDQYGHLLHGFNLTSPTKQCILSAISNTYPVSNVTSGDNLYSTVTSGTLQGLLQKCSGSGKQASGDGVMASSSRPEVGERLVTCAAQESKLNLWFSVALCFSYVMCSTLGPIMQRIGMRFFRFFFMLLFVVGCMCLAFASPVVPWLVCPGLCFVGLSGMAFYASNLHVGFLFPAVQSTITSVFVGLFDCSTVLAQVIKVAYEHGISRKYSFIAFACLHVVVVGTSTCFLLPAERLVPGSVKKTKKSAEAAGVPENQQFLKKPTDSIENEAVPVMSTLLSATYLLHVYWMCAHAIRFVTFLGFMSVQFDTMFMGDKSKESHYISVFSYVTLGTIASAITAGLLHDWQRRKYLADSDFRRKRMPIILPLVVTSILSLAITTLAFVNREEVLYLNFILFTIYRSYLFSFEATYINDVFPLRSFTLLFGILHSSAGISSMLQYPLFQWFDAYHGAALHVQLFLVLLQTSTFLHPLYVWISCRRHKHEQRNIFLDVEIHV